MELLIQNGSGARADTFTTLPKRDMRIERVQVLGAALVLPPANRPTTRLTCVAAAHLPRPLQSPRQRDGGLEAGRVAAPKWLRAFAPLTEQFEQIEHVNGAVTVEIRRAM